jgi:hypothetical protein
VIGDDWRAEMIFVDALDECGKLDSGKASHFHRINGSGTRDRVK